jgi:hypothetical protein
MGSESRIQEPEASRNSESRIQKSSILDFGLRTLDSRPWTLDWWWAGLLTILLAFLAPTTASAQSMTGVWEIEIYGAVQVEPGSNVLTLGVKDEGIRFAVNNVRCSRNDFSMARFLIETRRYVPGLSVKGPELMLETLLKERPKKRILKLRGLYHPTTRMFILTGLEEFRAPPGPNF